MSDADTKLTRLFGGPGSGKTTALLDRVEELLEDARNGDYGFEFTVPEET
jgi:superfamily I DNA/RNA helicase